MAFQLSKVSIYLWATPIEPVVVGNHTHARQAGQETNTSASMVGQPETTSFIRALAWGRYLSRAENWHSGKIGKEKARSRQVIFQAKSKRISGRTRIEREKSLRSKLDQASHVCEKRLELWGKYQISRANLKPRPCPRSNLLISAIHLSFFRLCQGDHIMCVVITLRLSCSARTFLFPPRLPLPPEPGASL